MTEVVNKTLEHAVRVVLKHLKARLAVAEQNRDYLEGLVYLLEVCGADQYRDISLPHIDPPTKAEVDPQ